MTRRTLVQGLQETPKVDSEVEQQFVKGVTAVAKELMPKVSSSAPIARTPISTRLRPDLAEALKRASLQRQLEKIEPNTLTDMLEAAIEPWLKAHGYLD